MEFLERKDHPSDTLCALEKSQHDQGTRWCSDRQGALNPDTNVSVCAQPLRDMGKNICTTYSTPTLLRCPHGCMASLSVDRGGPRSESTLEGRD